jgi:hypothetical protein
VSRGWKKTIVGSSGFGWVGSERKAKVILFSRENNWVFGREIIVPGFRILWIFSPRFYV